MDMSFPVRAPGGLRGHMLRPPFIAPTGVMPPMISLPPYRAPGAPLLPPPAGIIPKPIGAPINVSQAPPSINKKDLAEGPPVTVFVGNITSRAPDTMIRYILTSCGPVVNWKRVSAFGFCEFGSPEAGLRCVRLLHDREIGGKKLVAKVDAKTKTLLDEYKNEQRQKKLDMDSSSGNRNIDRDSQSDEDYMDAQQKAVDASALERIQQLISEYQDDMNNFEAIQLEEQIEKRNRILQEADIEEEKRDVIHREIGKFREIMKVQSVVSCCKMN